MCSSEKPGTRNYDGGRVSGDGASRDVEHVGKVARRVFGRFRRPEYAFAYGKGFAAAFLLAVTSYGGGTRAQIPTARPPITNSGVGD
jgi:hypothetical protein